MRLPLLENSQGRLEARQLEHLGYSLLQRTLRMRHSSQAGLNDPVPRTLLFWTDTLAVRGVAMMLCCGLFANSPVHAQTMDLLRTGTKKHES